MPTFSIAAVRDGAVDIESHLKFCGVEISKAAPYFVAQGDIFVLRGSGSKDLVGTAGIVQQTPPDNCIYPDILIRVRPSKRLTPWFLVECLNSAPVRCQTVVAAQTAAGIWKVSGSALQSIRIPCPPIAEQMEIESQVTATVVQLAELLDEAERAITLLQERRSALISAAVTGQIDVRNYSSEGAAA